MLHRGLVLTLVFSGAFLAVDSIPCTAQVTRTSVKNLDTSALDYERHRELSGMQQAMARQLSLGRGSTANGSQQDFEKYFNAYLERMTLKATLMDLPGIRNAMATDLVYLRSNSGMHTQMVGYLLTNLEKLARDTKVDALPITIAKVGTFDAKTDGQFPCDPPYERATRVNAMMMIAELNAEEPTNALTGEGARPYPAALDTILAAWGDDKLPIEIRVAALMGLDRHAQLGINDAATRAKVQAPVLALFNESATPEGRSTAAHVWLRQVAAKILGNLKDLGTASNKEETLQAMVTVISNKDEPLRVRCAAAEALNSLSYTPDVKFQDISKALGSLAVDAAVLETSNRGNLRHYLGCVSKGLGIPESGTAGTPQPASITKAATADADKKYITAVNAEMEKLIKAVTDKLKDVDEADDTLAISQERKRKIMQAAGDLQATLQTAGQADAANASGE